MAGDVRLDSAALAVIADSVGEAAVIEPEPEWSCDNMPDGDPDEGEMSFVMYCSDCHGEDGHGDRGPDLDGRLPESDRRICEAVVNGYLDMPSVEMDYEEVADVIAYLRELFPD